MLFWQIGKSNKKESTNKPKVKVKTVVIGQKLKKLKRDTLKS